MGRKISNNIKWSESLIQDVLSERFLSQSSKKYELFNLFVYSWESDYLCITKTGYIHEIEIKISREDFFNDFKHKDEKHKLLKENNKDNNLPNYFYYCVPKDLISIDEIPEYAGLIYVINEHFINIVKPAPKISQNKPILESFNLVDKFYYNMSSWRQKALKIQKEEIISLKEEINKCKLGIDGKKYKYSIEEAHKKIEELSQIITDKDKQINKDNNDLLENKQYIRQLQRILKENNIEYPL